MSHPYLKGFVVNTKIMKVKFLIFNTEYLGQSKHVFPFLCNTAVLRPICQTYDLHLCQLTSDHLNHKLVYWLYFTFDNENSQNRYRLFNEPRLGRGPFSDGSVVPCFAACRRRI